jgi:hypothetical protein
VIQKQQRAPSSTRFDMLKKKVFQCTLWFVIRQLTQMLRL